MYCAYTGICLGPASYEQAEAYEKYDPNGMPWNFAGGPTKVIVRKGPRREMVVF